MTTIEEIHQRGVRRHGAAWARANQRAVDILLGSELKPWAPGVKEAVCLIVLRLLDGARLDAGEEWLAANGRWTRREPRPASGPAWEGSPVETGRDPRVREAWFIFFEDPDVAPEMFEGEGAAEAARTRFASLRDNWNCSLFECTESTRVDRTPAASA